MRKFGTYCLMSADRHLLFGLLALQNEFISKSHLVSAFGAWIADRSRDIDEILVRQGHLSEEIRQLLSRLVDQHVESRGGSIEASLAALSSVVDVRRELESLADEPLQQSIAKLRPADPIATMTYGIAQASGSRFQVRRPLDRGGLGIVSVAIDQELNREVALKEIRDDRADEAAYRNKFLLEAEVTGGLEHPGIVPVYGLGVREDGRPYYAMRLIRGDNLRRHIQVFHERVAKGQERYDGPVLRRLLRRFLDICEAIDYAHSRGVLHRDLKPGNIMLGKYGETLVVDWGLAKVLGSAVPATSSLAAQSDNDAIVPPLLAEKPLLPSGSNSDLTVQGQMVGTAAYAPPEQLTGDTAGMNERSDVYGLGAILYELLTRQPPMRASSLEEAIRQVVRGEVPAPRAVCAQVPRALEAICLKALATRNQDRYATAADLRAEVERWLDDAPVFVHRDPWGTRLIRWTRRHPALSGAILATVIATTLAISSFAVLIAHKRDQLARINGQLRNAIARERNAHTEADKARERSQLLLYASQIKRAYSEWQYGSVKTAIETLDACEPALRGWEFQHLQHLFQRGRRSLAGHNGKVVAILPVTQSTTSSDVAASADKSSLDKSSLDNSSSADDTLTAVADEVSADIPGAAANAVDSNEIRWVTVATRDCKVWTSSAQSAARTFPINDASCAAVNPSGTWLAVGGFDRRVRIWNLADGKELFSFLMGPSDSPTVGAVAFDPTGNLLASVSGSEHQASVITLWDLGERRLLHRLPQPKSVRAIQFSPDGRRLACAGGDSRVTLLDTTSLQVQQRLAGHKGSISSLAYSPDATRLASGSDDGTVYVWDLATGKPRTILRGHDSDVNCVAFSADGKRLASGTGLFNVPGLVYVWDLTTGKRQFTLKGHQSHVSSLCFVPEDAKSLLTTGGDGTIELWQLSNVARYDTVRTFGNPRNKSRALSSISFAPHEPQMCIGSFDGRLEWWNTHSWRREAVSDRDTARRVWQTQFRPDGSSLLVASGAATKPGSLLLVDAISKVTTRLEGHRGPVQAVSQQANGTRCVTCSSGDGVGELFVWDLQQRAIVARRKEKDRTFRNVAMRPDGKEVAACAEQDSVVRIWNVDKNTNRLQLQKHVNGVNAVRYSPDGQYLVTAGGYGRYVRNGQDGGDLAVWNADTGELVWYLRDAHNYAIRGVCFHPDGRRIATCGEDNTVRIWHLREGMELLQLESGWGLDIAFSPSGNTLAAVHRDNLARMWHTQSPPFGGRANKGLKLGTQVGKDSKDHASDESDIEPNIDEPNEDESAADELEVGESDTGATGVDQTGAEGEGETSKDSAADDADLAS